MNEDTEGYQNDTLCGLAERDSLPSNLISKQPETVESMLYEPLPNPQSIRLLSLKPGNFYDDIRSNLRVVSLDDRPTYEALSYVVGDTSLKTPITCNEGSIDVTKNLQAALVHLRSSTAERVLWIDQICINQNDIEERNQQVSRMGQIFHKPQHVIVWLGLADDETSKIWQLLSELAAMQEIENLLGYHMDLMLKPTSFTGPAEVKNIHPWSSPDLPRTLSSLPPRDSLQWIALQRFLSCSWFHRVWTFQEGIVGPHCKVYQGMHVMPWLDLSDACKVITLLGLSRWIGDAQKYVAWISIQAVRWRSQKPSTLHFILVQTRARDATDPKDKIYAVRALVNNSCAAMIDVNYHRPLQDVYSDAVKTSIIQDNCLSILSCVEVRRTDESANSIPSWVPDWRFKTSVMVEFGFRNAGGSSYFAAAGQSLPNMLPAPNPSILTLRGFKVASIHAIIDVREKLRLNEVCLNERSVSCRCGRWDPDQWRTMYRTAAESTRFSANCVACREKLDPMITCVGNNLAHERSSGADSVETAFRRTVTADLLPRASGRLSEREAEIYPVTASWETKRFDDDAVAQMMLEYDTCVSDTMFNRELFIASQGQQMYMGIALGTLKKVDYLCIFLGGDTPFLLRQNGNAWKFVAEAYVYGLMDGEALERTREEGFEYEDFTLA